MSRKLFFNKKRRVPKFLQLYLTWLSLTCVVTGVASFWGIQKSSKEPEPKEKVASFVKSIPDSFRKKVQLKQNLDSGLVEYMIEGSAPSEAAVVLLGNSEESKRFALKLSYHYGKKIRVFSAKSKKTLANRDLQVLRKSRKLLVLSLEESDNRLPLMRKDLHASALAFQELLPAQSWKRKNVFRQILDSATGADLIGNVGSSGVAFVEAKTRGWNPIEIKRTVQRFLDLPVSELTPVGLWLSRDSALKLWYQGLWLFFLAMVPFLPLLNRLVLRSDRPDVMDGLWSNLYLFILPVGILIISKVAAGDNTVFYALLVGWVIVYLGLFLRFGAKRFNIRASAGSVLILLIFWILMLAWMNSANLAILFYFPVLIVPMSRLSIVSRLLVLAVWAAPGIYYLYGLPNAVDLLRGFPLEEQLLWCGFAGSVLSSVLMKPSAR